ncbi:MAG: hypothetical protein PWQ25_2162 [Deferribacteres bacterium]|jgi:hypothetical protein|nr:hypothetical protein [Deferribacteres bacterium]
MNGLVNFDTDKFDNGTVSNAYFFKYKGTANPANATSIDCGVIYDVDTTDNTTNIVIGTDGCE